MSINRHMIKSPNLLILQIFKLLVNCDPPTLINIFTPSFIIINIAKKSHAHTPILIPKIIYYLNYSITILENTKCIPNVTTCCRSRLLYENNDEFLLPIAFKKLFI